MTFRIFFGSGGPPQPKGNLLAQAATLSGVGEVINPPVGILLADVATLAASGTVVDPPKVYMRPASDVVAGGWVDQNDSTSGIYAVLDEEASEDADFVKSPPIAAGDGGTFTIGDLDTVTTPITFGTSTFQKISQSFVSIGTSISKLRIALKKYGNPTDGVKVGIFTADANHMPVTQIGAYSNVVPYTAIATTLGVHEFLFATPITVASGTEYCLVIERSVATFSFNCYEAGVIYPDQYVEGWFHSWTGSSWNTAYVDFMDVVVEMDFVEPVTITIGTMPGTNETIIGHTFGRVAAQSFISLGTEITSIKVELKKLGSPTDNVRVRIFTPDVNHFPDVQVGVTSSLVPGPSLGTGFAVFEFTFSPPVPVTEGIEYVYAIERTGTYSSAHWYASTVQNGNPYPDGVRSYQDDTGWHSSPTSDLIAIVEQTDTPVAGLSLTVRLFDGSTEIAAWTHADVTEEFADAEQTLTAPQAAAISNFSNLFAELDDNNGNVYRFALGAPDGSVSPPIKVKYRYKQLAA